MDTIQPTPLPDNNEVRWEHLFRDQLETRFQAAPVLYLTYGLCEPHGPHNVLGLDSLKAHGLACRAAQLGGGIVAPPDYWHCHESGEYALFAREWMGEIARPWLTAVPPWHHFKSVLYHLRAADLLGFKAVILLTGHYGLNWKDLRRMVELVQPQVGARLWGGPDFEFIDDAFGGTNRGDHAGRIETSQLMALHPAGVDTSRLALAAEPEGRFAAGPDAGEADRREGERIVNLQAVRLAQKAMKLLDDFEAQRPSARLTTFLAVEHLWSQTLLPHLGDFYCFRNNPRNAADAMPPESRWAVNYDIESQWRQANDLRPPSPGASP